MITLQDFIDLSMDTYYKINIYSIDLEQEILHQVKVDNIEAALEERGQSNLLYYNIASWDISEEHNNEFTINI